MISKKTSLNVVLYIQPNMQSEWNNPRILWLPLFKYTYIMCVIYLFTRTDADRPRHNTQPHKQTDAQSHRQTDRCTITQTDRGSNKKQTCTVVHLFCTVYGICVTINLVTSVSGAICCYSCRAFFRRSCHRNTTITGASAVYCILYSVQCTVYSNSIQTVSTLGRNVSWNI